MTIEPGTPDGEPGKLSSSAASNDAARFRIAVPRLALALIVAAATLVPAALLIPATAARDETVLMVLSAAGRGTRPVPLCPAWFAVGRVIWSVAPAAAPRLLALFSALCISAMAAFSALLFLDLPQDRMFWQRSRRLPRAIRYWWPALAAGVLVGWSPPGFAQALVAQPEAMGGALAVLSAWRIGRTYRRRQETDAGFMRSAPTFSAAGLLGLGLVLGLTATFGGLITLSGAVLVLVVFALDPSLLLSPRRLIAGALGLVLGGSALLAQAWALSHGDNPALGAPSSFYPAAKALGGVLLRSLGPRGTRFYHLFFLVLFAAIPSAFMIIRVEGSRDFGAKIRIGAVIVLLPVGILVAATNVFQPISPWGPDPAPFPGAPPDAMPLVAWSAIALAWIVTAVMVGLLGAPTRERGASSASSRRVIPVQAAWAAVGLFVALCLGGVAWRTSSQVERLVAVGTHAAQFEAALHASVQEAIPGPGEGCTVIGDGTAVDGRLRLALRDQWPRTEWVNVNALERSLRRRPTEAQVDSVGALVDAVAPILETAFEKGAVLLVHPDLCAPLPGARPEPFGMLHRMMSAADTHAGIDAWRHRQARFGESFCPAPESRSLFPSATFALRWSRFANELAVLSIAGGEPEAARLWALRATGMLPGNVAAWGNLALGYSASGDVEEFERCLESARAEARNMTAWAGRRLGYVSVHRNLGDVATPIWFTAAAAEAMRQGYNQGAAYLAGWGATLYPDNYRLTLLSGGLRILLRPDTVDTEIARLHERHPDEPLLEMGVGLWHWMAGNLEQAAATLDRAAETLPDHVAPRLLLSRLRQQEGNLRGALDELRTASRMGFESAESAQAESRILLAMGEPLGAEQTIRTALETFPDDTRLLVALGQIQAERGLAEEALASLDAAYAADPSYPGLRTQRLFLRSSVDPGPDAELEARELTHDPDEAWAGYLTLARLAHKKGDMLAAERHYRTTLELRESALALNNLAVIVASPGDRQNMEEALELSRRALEAEPGNAAVIDTRGWIALRAGEIDEAALQLDRAWQHLADAAGVSPADRASVTLHLAVLRARQGRMDETRSLLAEIDRDLLPNEDRPYYDSILRETEAEP